MIQENTVPVIHGPETQHNTFFNDLTIEATRIRSNSHSRGYSMINPRVPRMNNNQLNVLIQTLRE